MELINKYFPNITEEQRQRFAALDALYRDWNSKINVIPYCLFYVHFPFLPIKKLYLCMV